MENTDNNPASRPGFSTASFAEDTWFRYSRQIVGAVIVIVVALLAWFVWKSVSASQEAASNKKLGAIYVLLREDNLPAAEQALNEFLGDRPAGLAADKANLFLGKVYFLQQRYDESMAAYGAVKKRGKAVSLLHSGALHGRAASAMQKGDYATAVESLTELVKTYGARTGAPQENLAGEEVADFAPNIANALWKLALCQRELGQLEEAKATSTRLVRTYPASREARDAEKLLTVL
jgi:TolA-binding protein